MHFSLSLSLSLSKYRTALESAGGEELSDAAVAAEMKRLRANEAQLMSELAEARVERHAREAAMGALRAEERRLEELEQRYWREVNAFEVEQETLLTQKSRHSATIDVERAQLRSLTRADVVNDAFHIRHVGHYGTINGLRLGRFPGAQVDWVETNAALGHVALLLVTLARELGAPKGQFELHALGSFSKITRANDGTLELYGSSDISLSRLFWNKRFDNALSWLLAHLDYVCSCAGPQFRRPAPIDAAAHTIGGVSVRQQGNTDEKWTESMLNVLATCKALVRLARGQPAP